MLVSRIFGFLLSLGTVVMVTASAQAAVMFYSDKTTFQTAASSMGISLHLDDFEDTALVNNGNSVPFDDGTIAHAGNNLDVDPVDMNFGGPTITSRGIDWVSTGQPIVFNFDFPVNAFGIDIVEFRFVGDLIFSTNSGAMSTPYSGGNLPVRPFAVFLGVIDTTPFTQVTLFADEPTDAVEADNVQYGAIPEPGTLALFGLGLAGLGFARRRKAA